MSNEDVPSTDVDWEAARRREQWKEIHDALKPVDQISIRIVEHKLSIQDINKAKSALNTVWKLYQEYLELDVDP